MVQAGHQDVYFLRFNSASHPSYTMDDYNDAQMYQSVLHAFYKKYDLPFIDEYANQGKDALEKLDVRKQKSN